MVDNDFVVSLKRCRAEVGVGNGEVVSEALFLRARSARNNADERYRYIKQGFKVA